MSQKIDEFCEDLRNKLNAADQRLKDLKASATNASQRAKDEAKAQLNRLENDAKEQRAQIQAAEAKVKQWAQEKKTNTDEKIAQWKSERQTKKLNDRADGAEIYADAAIEIAVAAVGDAERAVVEAIVARLDASQAPAAARAG
jgi:hypothetical protein